jgi:hypothetical protein
LRLDQPIVLFPPVAGDDDHEQGKEEYSDEDNQR